MLLTALVGRLDKRRDCGPVNELMFLNVQQGDSFSIKGNTESSASVTFSCLAAHARQVAVEHPAMKQSHPSSVA